MRMDFADRVSVFLDQAGPPAPDTSPISAPPETAIRRVELDLRGRPGVTHAILRPAWFMQNFSETFLKPAGSAIAVPAGNGAEAFADADDITAVASPTLADPQAHAGAQYALTGPEALTIAEAAKIISDVSGQVIDYTDIDRDEWIAAAITGGVPAAYGAVLSVLTETIASGHGSLPSRSSGEFTQAVIHVADVRTAVEEMRRRGVAFEEYDTPETRTENGVAAMPGGGEAAWFKDSEGNLVGLVPA